MTLPEPEESKINRITSGGNDDEDADFDMHEDDLENE